MSLDAHNFFQIIMSGFVMVWMFRKGAGRKEKLGEFEYFAMSAFWGVTLLMFISITKTGDAEFIKKMGELLKDPFVSGFVFAILGGAIAGVIGYAVRPPNVLLNAASILKKLWLRSRTHWVRSRAK